MAQVFATELAKLVLWATLLLSYFTAPLPLPFAYNYWKPAEWPFKLEPALSEIRELIPPRASVSAQANVGAHFSQRYRIEQFSVEGWKFLYYNAQYIMDRLPSTVSMLLDNLRSQLSQLLTKGLIGDAPFVKGLDNALENATKHLSKSDSVNCYKDVAAFQDEVNKEYLKTVDDDKKAKARDKRFVTAEGWQVLYYGAQEIMARLPSGKRK